MKDGAQFWEGAQSSGEEDRLEKELIQMSLKMNEWREKATKADKELLILKANFNTLETSYYKALGQIDELKDKVHHLMYSTYNPPDL